MLFPTAVFAVFFLFVFTGSWLLAKQNSLWKLWLLASSYLFYGWWNWRFLFLIVACSVVNFLIAAAISKSSKSIKKRILLALALVFDLGVLGFFKYYGFFVMSAYRSVYSLNVFYDWLRNGSFFQNYLLALPEQINLSCSLPLLDVVLPVGISFFTFQAMSYIIDVYRSEIPASKSLLDFSTYLSFFPQLVAGPIVRASVLLPQFSENVRRHNIDAGRASTLILAGLFKKIVVANSISRIVVDPVFEDPSAYAAPDIILGVYGYAIQIYCDFSAYSDIAIGVALLLGFRFPINFNAPYFASSFREFWQRWHISLSTWLRDYLYIPLGGSRGKQWHVQRNLFITFLLGGLWHGAQWRFVMWGALHGSYLMLERLLLRLVHIPRNSVGDRVLRVASGVVVFNLVCLAWVFFRVQSFSDAWVLLGQLGCWKRGALWSFSAVFLLLIGFSMQLLDGRRMEPVWNWLNRQSFLLHGALVALILTLILGFGPKGVAPFIYFQF